MIRGMKGRQTKERERKARKDGLRGNLMLSMA